MKIMYIHGFGSRYNTDNDKVVALQTLGEVVGMSYDYTADAATNVENLTNFALLENVDLIVGTSLGGWYAARVGANMGLPMVMINPATRPHQQLQKYIGGGVDHYDNPYTMTQETCDTYEGLDVRGFGLALVDRGDDVIDPTEIKHMDHSFLILTYPDGSHRFDHINESLKSIYQHYLHATLISELVTD